MAKKQSRRSVSLSRVCYDAVSRAASARGVSMAEYVTEALRAQGLDVPETQHMHVEDAEAATIGRLAAAARRENGWL